MPAIKPFNSIMPNIAKNCFIAENATIIGQVTIGDNCSIWYGCVLRGDAGSIKIGKCTNIQDGAVIHCSEGKSETDIGDNVTIGHNAIVHGATIKDNVLIGMGATILDNAIVNENTIIGANALVPGNLELEPNSIYAGVPAKKVKVLPQNYDMIKESALHYCELKDKYMEHKREWISSAK